MEKNLYLTRQKLAQSEASHKKSYTSRKGKYMLQHVPLYFYKESQS
jgi:hypothetical protein